MTIHLFACCVEIRNVSPWYTAQLSVLIVRDGASLSVTSHTARSSAHWLLSPTPVSNQIVSVSGGIATVVYMVS